MGKSHIGPLLSIIVLVYNQAEYVEETLNSIQEQNVSFDFEVYIGEDCSTDRSREVLRNYQVKAPDNFHFIYREKNMGVKENLVDLCARTNGKYVTLIEGDDYWINRNKLQFQVDFLESHSDYIAIAHNVFVINHAGKKLPYRYQTECHHTNYTLKDFRKYLLPGQTATIVYRNIYKDNEINQCCYTDGYPIDRRIAFILASWGKVYCVQEKWSAYRHNLLFGDSFSSQKVDAHQFKRAQRDFFNGLWTYAQEVVKSRDSIKICEQCYYKVLFRDSFFPGAIWSKKQFWEDFKKADNKLEDIVWIVNCIICYPIHSIPGKIKTYYIKIIQKKYGGNDS